MAGVPVSGRLQPGLKYGTEQLSTLCNMKTIVSYPLGTHFRQKKGITEHQQGRAVARHIGTHKAGKDKLCTASTNI